jgi:hypothetical protein
LKNCDVLNINGYKWFGNNRQEFHKNAKRGSGGVGFLIKNHLVEIFEIGILNKSIEGIL